MKTRNQVSGSGASTGSSGNIAPEPNAATNLSDDSEPHQTIEPNPISNQMPLPARLRERRSSAILTDPPKTSLIPPSQPANSAQIQSSSPPAGIKRPSMAPTRVLPRRSCGRPTSLLVKNESAPCSTSNKSLSNNRTSLLGSSKPPDQVSTKRDTHPRQVNSRPASADPQELASSISEPSNVNKTANISRNHSRDVPLTRNSLLSKPVKHDNTGPANNKTKLVQISLPGKVGASSSGNSKNSLDQSKVSSVAEDRYFTTTNGSKKVGPATMPHLSAKDSSSLASDVISSQSEIEDVAQDTSAPKTREFNVLICVTGSVAAIKLVELTQKIKSIFPKSNANKSPADPTFTGSVKIKIVMTHNSKHFVPKEELIKSLDDPSIQVHDDADEWSLWKKMNDPVLHIELRKWADLCLIAPLDANTMSKLANGICDNLLTCIVRAWDCTKPLVYCPAMNVHMYNHPLTREQLCKLQSFGYLRVDSVEKRLACGDFGMGGMAPVESIANKVLDCLTGRYTRRPPITRPLLNQQPTYPIISTTEEHDTQSIITIPRNQTSLSNQILNRFRTNNQITIHPVPTNSQSRNLISICASSDLARKRRRPCSPDGIDNYFSPGYNDRNRANCSANSPTGNDHRRRSNKIGGVTSVQNLKAIALGSDEDESNYNALDDGFGLDFDPSKLLEQTMITDDFFASPYESRNLSSSDPGYSVDRASLSTAREESLEKAGSLTHIFNTSKFLSMCYNKERGCFTCTICKNDYKNRKSMARHLKEQHVQGNIYQCGPCGVSYKRREKLIKHNREHHPDMSSINHR